MGLAVIPAVLFCEERVLDVWWRDRALQDAYRHEPQELAFHLTSFGFQAVTEKSLEFRAGRIRIRLFGLYLRLGNFLNLRCEHIFTEYLDPLGKDIHFSSGPEKSMLGSVLQGLGCKIS